MLPLCHPAVQGGQSPFSLKAEMPAPRRNKGYSLPLADPLPMPPLRIGIAFWGETKEPKTNVF